MHAIICGLLPAPAQVEERTAHFRGLYERHAANGARGVYDATGFRLRGHQVTDENGAYKVVTIVPGPAGGQARHLGVRVHPAGKPTFTTLLFFSDDPGSAKDPAAKPELVMKVTEGPDGASATMDIVLDKGNAAGGPVRPRGPSSSTTGGHALALAGACPRTALACGRSRAGRGTLSCSRSGTCRCSEGTRR
jgi:hypothetical protein